MLVLCRWFVQLLLLLLRHWFLPLWWLWWVLLCWWLLLLLLLLVVLLLHSTGLLSSLFPLLTRLVSDIGALLKLEVLRGAFSVLLLLLLLQLLSNDSLVLLNDVVTLQFISEAQLVQYFDIPGRVWISALWLLLLLWVLSWLVQGLLILTLLWGCLSCLSPVFGLVAEVSYFRS